MKTNISLIICAIIMMAAPKAHAWEISDLFKKNDTTESTTSDSKTDTGLGSLISGLGNALGITGKMELKDLAGTWEYKEPAVVFKSDNLLLKAGGAAAATTVEKKLEPYYKTAGFNNLKVIINSDSTFTFKMRVSQVNGIISKNENTGNYIFTFQALKSIKIGEMEAYIVKNGNLMSLTFDVSKLMTILQKVGTLTNSTSIKTITALLDQYEGVTAGFQLTRTAEQQK